MKDYCLFPEHMFKENIAVTILSSFENELMGWKDYSVVIAFQQTWVQFLAFTRCLTAIIIPVPGDLTLSELHVSGIQVAHIHICRQTLIKQLSLFNDELI